MGKPITISAAQIKSAVGNAVKNNAAAKGLNLNELAIGHIHPPIFGYILRDKDLAKQPVSALQDLATSVAQAIPAAKGATPTALVHAGDIIIGFIETGRIAVLRE